MLKRRLLVAGSLLLALSLSACGSSSSGGSAGSAVNVLYAGSLVHLMEQQIGPGFESATKDSLVGFSAGSTALAQQIKGKVHQGDVFISASAKANEALEGPANGNWESWHLTFATAGLVLGYNPGSRFAAELRSKPWYQVITEAGFRLGSTDPATDPKGVLAAEALSETAAAKGLPALRALATNSALFFPEETLVGRLQAGELDAGFFYAPEAKAAGIATVPLTGTDLKAKYTITILAHAPHDSAAVAFVTYLLGPSGRAALEQDGFTVLTPPRLKGTGMPTSLNALLR